MITLSFILGTVFIILEAICNAIMDTIDHHSGKSIFPKTLWWNSNKGWLNKYIDRDQTKGRVQWDLKLFKMNKPVQLTDAWHFFKMLGIICYVSAGVCLPSIFILLSDLEWYLILGNMLAYILGLGLIRNNVFSLFYNKLLLK